MRPVQAVAPSRPASEKSGIPTMDAKITRAQDGIHGAPRASVGIKYGPLGRGRVVPGKVAEGLCQASQPAFLPKTFAMSKSMKSAWWKIQLSMVRSTLSPSWLWVATMCITSGGRPCL